MTQKLPSTFAVPNLKRPHRKHLKTFWRNKRKTLNPQNSQALKSDLDSKPDSSTWLCDLEEVAYIFSLSLLIHKREILRVLSQRANRATRGYAYWLLRMVWCTCEHCCCSHWITAFQTDLTQGGIKGHGIKMQMLTIALTTAEDVLLKFVRKENICIHICLCGSN